LILKRKKPIRRDFVKPVTYHDTNGSITKRIESVDAGKYIFVFDNSSSPIRKRRVNFQIAIESPETAAMINSEKHVKKAKKQKKEKKDKKEKKSSTTTEPLGNITIELEKNSSSA